MRCSLIRGEDHSPRRSKDEAGRVIEDGWFVFVNLAREPLFRALRPESVYATVSRLRRRLGRSLSSPVRRFVFEFSERRPPSYRLAC
jgi:hypothetical protein